MKIPATVALLASALFCVTAAWAGNTVDPNTVAATDVVADPDGTPVVLTNPVADPLSLGSQALAVGNTGNGEFLIDAGSDVSNGFGYVGYQFGSLGTVTVDGAGSSWTNANELDVARSGTGTLNILDGGNVSSSSGYVGLFGGADGTVLIDGAASEWSITSFLYVGNSGTGALTVQDGGQLTNATARIGNSGTGVITIDGLGSTWTNSANLYAGSGGNGTLNIQNGGTVSNGTTFVALLGTSTGNVNVSGAGSTWNTSGSLYIGGQTALAGGSGTVQIIDGASTGVTGTTKLWNTGTLHLDGGTLTTGSFDNTEGGTFNFDDGELIVDGGTYTPDPNGGGLLIDGSDPNANPTLTLINGATTPFLPGMTVGYDNQGTLNILSGSSVTTDFVEFGANAGSSGTVLVDGTESALNTGIELNVGSSLGLGGVGELTVSNGGLVSSGFANVKVGSNATVDGAGSQLVYYASTNIQGTLDVQNGGAVAGGTPGSVGYIGSGGVVTIDGAGSTWSDPNGGLSIAGQLNIQNGGGVDAFAFVGEQVGETGTVVVDGVGSSWTSTSAANIGYSGDGMLTVQNGGSVVSQSGNIAYTGNSTSDVIVDGDGSSWNNTFDLRIGRGGDGTLTIQNGGDVFNRQGIIADSSGSVSMVTVDGAGSSWNNTMQAYVGFYGDATLHILNGGTVTSTDGIIARQSSSVGSVLVDGAGSNWSTNSIIHVGFVGEGNLTIQNGGTISSGSGFIGNNLGSQGTVIVSGAGSLWSNTSALTIGKSSKGLLSVTNGGAVSSATGHIADDPNSDGNVLVDGAGSIFSSSGSLYVGEGGQASLYVSNAAKVQAGDVIVASEAGSLANVTVSDPNSTLTSSDVLWIGSNGTGHIDIISGASVTSNSATFGVNSGMGSGYINGAESNLTVQGLLTVGSLGNATLDVHSGAAVSNTTGRIAATSFSTANVYVEGVGATWTNTDSLYVGGNSSGAGGSGSLEISNSGLVEVTNTTKLWNGGGLTINGGTLKTGSFDNTAGGTLDFQDGELIVDGGTFDQGTTELVLNGADPNANPVLTLINGASPQNVTVARLGDSRSGTLSIQSGSTLNSSGGIIGSAVGSNGMVTMEDPNTTWTSSSSIYVGQFGNGDLTVQSGSGLISQTGYIGAGSNATGNATVTGNNSTWTMSSGLEVGTSGVGTLTISDGGSVSNTSSYIGRNASGNGQVLVTGAESQWTNDGDLRVGRDGEGTLVIADGGTVSNKVGTIGYSGGSVGSVTVEDPNSHWINSQYVAVGFSGEGTLLIQNGGRVTSTEASMGTGATAVGVATIDGAGSDWTATSNRFVGSSGSGTLSILNGGSASNNSAFIADFGGSTGDATVDGPGSTWSSAGGLYVGGGTGSAGGNATLDITNSGAVNVGSVTRIWNTGTLTIGGGTLTTNSFDNTAGGTLNFDDGQLIVDGGAFMVDPNGPDLVVSGGDPNANPTLILTGGATSTDPPFKTTFGDTNRGSLIVNGASTFSSTNAYLGKEISGVGSAVVDDAGSSWNNSSNMYIGYYGNGTLDVSDGGTVSSLTINIGLYSGSNGTVNVDGADSTLTGFSSYIGSSGTGTLSISDGGAMSGGYGLIGQGPGSNGTANVDGASSNWTMMHNLEVGSSGTGTLNISGGGTVSNEYGFIGRYSGSNGTVTVEGAGSTWSSTYGVYIGGSDSAAGGTGTLTIGTGALGPQDGTDGLVEMIGALPLYVYDTPGSGLTLQGGTLRVHKLQVEDPNDFNWTSGTLHITGTDLVLGAADPNRPLGKDVEITAGQTLIVDNQIVIGKNTSGAETLLITGGVVDAGRVITGDENYGTLQIQGTGSGLNVAGSLDFGFNYDSDAYILQGAAVTSMRGTIGSNNGTSGYPEVRIYDEDSAWIIAEDLRIGENGRGQLTVSDGGRLEIGTDLIVGSNDPFQFSSVYFGGELLVANSITVLPNSGFSFGSGTIHLTGDLPFASGDQLGSLRSIAAGMELEVDGTTTLADVTMSLTGGRFSTGSLDKSTGGFSWTAGDLHLSGGTANLDLAVPFGSTLGGSGLYDGRIVGSINSHIVADGPLSLGDASQVNGFATAGNIVTGANVVTLLDSNDALVDSTGLVTLGEGGAAGTLAAPNGLTLDFGGNIVGVGTIDTPNDPAKPFINNGNITGDDPNAPIELTGYVKGVGTLDNFVITGTDAPGFSPATVNRGSGQYDGVLEIELGGTSDGSFDQINHILGAGIADLGGSLDVSLINGFTPSLGDSFEILTAFSVLDAFDTEILPTLSSELAWSVDYQPTSVLLSVGRAGDFDGNDRVDGFDFFAWQRDASLGSLADWEVNYGTPITATTTTVPEPSTLLLFALASVAIPLRQGRD